MARQAAIQIPQVDYTSDAVVQTGLVVESKPVTLSAAKAADGKEHTDSYQEFTVTNRAQALAAVGSDDSVLWKIIGDWLTNRSYRNARARLYQDAQGLETTLEPIVWRLLDSGLPGADAIAAQTVTQAFTSQGKTINAEEYVAKVRAAREKAAAKKAEKAS